MLDRLVEETNTEIIESQEDVGSLSRPLKYEKC